jgi:hypothetical protein
LAGIDNKGDIGRDGQIILKWILKKYDMRVWTQDRDQWQTLVNMVMNLHVP